ncbi:hypothetical protein SISSUDRAFT_729800 [Sistotremastrum suecicum HHB10207 ss-3]|uniref:DUF6533 domain-containing protein n=1 Tax=Sistotremastrum suecicum HHB10207 ss-3 TaxID=1314776 RepID=A0A166DHW1_9AGAM|nr:hypothetical protein SISSUDRAFT_729800 [Sistotremastrum suecicum HHB10207 ss-3]
MSTEHSICYITFHPPNLFIELPIDAKPDDLRNLRVDIERSICDIRMELSAVMWLHWDLIISFEDEIIYVWKKPTRCNILYLYERYFVLILVLTMGPIWNGWAFDRPPSNGWCHGIGIYQSFIALISILGTDVILILRVSALYKSMSCHRTYTRVLKFLVGACILQFLGVIAIAIPGLTGDRTLIRIPLMPGPTSERWSCISAQIPSFRIGNWMTSIAFETILVLMTLYQSIKHEFHKRKSIWGAAILIDGLTVYFLLLVTSIICEIAWSWGLDKMIAVFYPWNVAAISFSGSRLIVNMRKAANPALRSPIDSIGVRSAFELDDIVFCSNHPPEVDDDDDDDDVIDINRGGVLVPISLSSEVLTRNEGIDREP